MPGIWQDNCFNAYGIHDFYMHYIYTYTAYIKWEEKSR